MAALTRRIAVRLHHTDAAGILFFANQFVLAHDLLEEFMKIIGLPIGARLRTELFRLPIVHAESQYVRSVTVGDEVDITLTLANIGTTSFALAYTLKTPQGELVGTTKTVHVSIDRQTGAKIPLPDILRTALEGFQSAS
jgi:1,4-dihydroxy-2-naphthoyl-CoA hydrolase